MGCIWTTAVRFGLDDYGSGSNPTPNLETSVTPSEIARLVGVNYASAAKHLEALEAEGVLQHIMFGKRIRYYKFNESSDKAIAVRNLIETSDT